MTTEASTDATLEVRPLTVETWAVFDALVQRHNGIFGGCWCIWFHPDGTRRLYERLGFTYVRPKGLKICVMAIEVPAQP